jgi:hypothetical protein
MRGGLTLLFIAIILMRRIGSLAEQLLEYLLYDERAHCALGQGG